MAGSIFWRVIGVLAALALVGWIFWNVFNRTTVNLTVRYDPNTQAAQTAPAPPSAPATAPAAPAADRAVPVIPPQVSPDIKLIMEAMERMDLRNQAQIANVNQRLDEFGRRMDSQSSGAPPPPPSPTPTGCPAGCVSGTQKVSAR